MTDIVERLRSRDNPNNWTREVREEAADEIERLRELTANVPGLVARAEKVEAVLLDMQERLRIQRDLTDTIAEQVRTVRVPARNAALEEAAKVADGKAEMAIDFAPHIGRAAQEIAAAVRALKEKASDG